MPRNFDILSSGKSATVKIIGDISSWGENNSAEFSEKIDALINSSINYMILYINCFGGSVLEANEIANSLIRYTGKLKIQIGAIAASAVTMIIAMIVAAKTEAISVEMYSNGQFMIHNVRGGISGTIQQIESHITLMKNLQESGVDAYVKMTGLDKATIIEMMDKETWMSAKEALEKKFITGIISGNASAPENVASIRNCGYSNVPFETLNFSQTKSKNDMDLTLINATMGTDFKNESEALAHMAELRAKVVRLEATEKDREAALQKAQVDGILDTAVKERKMTPEQKEAYRPLLENNFDVTKKLIENLKPAAKLSNGLKPETPEKDTRADWTYSDYMEKDPEALEAIRKNDPTKFQALAKDFYGEELV